MRLHRRQRVEPSREAVPIAVERLPLTLDPDPSRVIMRFFGTGNVDRARHIIERVLRIPESEVERLLSGLEADFHPKHPRLLENFADHYEQLRASVPDDQEISESRRLLLGACFTMEYALESVALFNPSIVPALRQDGVPPGSVRFVMSLRPPAKGTSPRSSSGSASSTRRGISSWSHPVLTSGRSRRAFRTSSTRRMFQRDLATLGVQVEAAGRILDRLGPRFTRDELAEAIKSARGEEQTSGFLEETGDILIAATQANYRLDLPDPPAEPRVGDRDLPVLGHRAARHRRSAAGAVHRR